MSQWKERYRLPRNRRAMEERDQLVLAPFAVIRAQEGSRDHPDDNGETDNRGAFQRDRDRIIHTAAFRRLQYQTQLFVNYEGDYYRTRLTHTLEVSQLARGVCKSLALNEELAEAIALGHDLGHTPFGHAVERYFDRLCREGGVGRFFHNEQSVRLVENLEQRTSSGPRGLNLTREVREGILKHNGNTSGAYPKLSPGTPCAHLEGQVVSLVDTVAYLCHDLEDVIVSGHVEESSRLNPDLRQGFARMQQLIGDYTGLVFDYDSRREPFFIRSLTHFLITGLTQDTLDRLERYQVHSQEQVAKLAGQGISLVAFEGENLEFFTGLRALVENNIYRSHPIAAMDAKAVSLMRGLAEACLENPKLLPPDWYYLYTHCDREDHGAWDTPLRVVCDYLSCLTDRSAVEERERLFNPKMKTY